MASRPQPQWIRVLADAFLRFTVLFVAANLILAVPLLLMERTPADVLEDLYGDLLPAVYPHLSSEEREALINETWSRPWVYDPWTQFREREGRGQYVSVSEHGFRGSAAPWPPPEGDTTVFLFGGSTTFGYGVTDDQALGVRLQQQLAKVGRPLRVYNFGSGSFFSSQERALFERLLLESRGPDIAVFFDGVNEFNHPTGLPAFTSQLAAAMAEQVERGRARRALLATARWLPVTRLLGRALDRLGLRDGGEPPPPRDETTAARVVSRYLENRRMIQAIAREYGVKTLFVWQPIPVYDLDLRRHPFSDRLSVDDMRYAVTGYDLMESRREEPGFLWLGNLHAEAADPLYVDLVHYSPQFIDLIAERIARAMP
jgi:hypothetical protein